VFGAMDYSFPYGIQGLSIAVSLMISQGVGPWMAVFVYEFIGFAGPWMSIFPMSLWGLGPWIAGWPACL
jgi:hypothetical protein